MGGEQHPGSPPLRGASGDTFVALLDRLKRRGTSVLVVGDFSTDLERALSRRMMGHPNEPRYRLLAALKPLNAPDRWFPGSVDPADEWVEVADHAGLARSATAAMDGAPSVDPEPPRATALVDRVGQWVDAIPEDAEADYGAVRVGVASLDVLLEREGVGGVRRVVERVHGLMRDNQGVAHLYFPRSRDSRVVERVSVWADVVVEVRTSEGRPEQRWSVQDTVETSWFPVRDDGPHDRVER